MKTISFNDLETYKGFEEIDKKVAFIERERHICEHLIRELNKSIDLDYVKQSEKIEYNSVKELDNFVINENTKVLRAEPMLPVDELLSSKDEEEYYEILDKQYDNSHIVVYNKKNDNIDTTIFPNSCHLKALDVALRQARKDRRAIKAGEHPVLESDFIEDINELLLSDLLLGGPTAGLGRYRSRVYRYGEFTEINVRVTDALFETTKGAKVRDEMLALIEEYNNSNLHPILKALVFKTKFIKIHPFSDFNGRTSRILLNYMLVRYGYPTVTIKGSQKDRYLNAMNSAIIENNYAPIIELIKDLMNKRCDKYISIIQEQEKRLPLD